MTINHGDLEIDVTNIITSDPDSGENTYQFRYINDNSKFRPACKHGIRTSQNSAEIASAIIFGYGSATGISQNSFLITENVLLICCGDQVYSLNLPSLKLNWNKKFDMATCFAIYPFQSDFIIHGEVDITRITATGEVKWDVSARDIFVNTNGYDRFELVGDKIIAVDFSNYEYTISSDGIFLNDRLL